MRAVWVDSGNDPDWATHARHSISASYFDIFDPRVTKTYLEGIKAKGQAVGVYMAWNWPQFDGKSPEEVAEIVNTRVRQIAGGGLKPSFPKVQFDLEQHDPDAIIRVLRRWRQIMPNQDTSWTMEAFQGGWMSDAFVQEIIALRIRVVPQAYTGDMRRMSEDGTLRDLIRRGFPEALVTLFYDAAQLPINWDGFAFTQGRLP